MPSAISPATWKDFGPRIAPIRSGRCCLDRAGEREETAVAVELPLEVDRALVEERAHDMVRLLHARERLDVRPLDPVLREEAEVADREDASARPPVSSSSVAERLTDECRLAQADRA